MVKSACVKDAVFGVLTPLSSTIELSSRKASFVAMLESTTGSKRGSQDDQDLFLNMNTTSTNSLDVRGDVAISVSCKRVCVERVETMVGIDI
ncbi:hypothetical protein ZWY2020_049217 [Hordeum vulgare]|nr:hypothetical protein ZWY2020_049217 [Hordeum vulgare]